MVGEQQECPGPGGDAVRLASGGDEQLWNIFRKKNRKNIEHIERKPKLRRKVKASRRIRSKEILTPGGPKIQAISKFFNLQNIYRANFTNKK